MTAATPRKYALIRVKAGDYLLPSNDTTTLWRIVQYEEDGSAEVSADGTHWRRLHGKFWNLFRRPMPNDEDEVGRSEIVSLDEWDGWEHWSGLHKTREDAIGDVMRAGGSRV